MQNIGAGNADDAFYRYKMPKLVAKVEGRGNGIKTNIVNNVDIAKALARPPEYVLKYYGCELGAQTNFEVKTGTSIVNGSHDNKKFTTDELRLSQSKAQIKTDSAGYVLRLLYHVNMLGEILEGFIKKYVQCYSCGNPETQVKVKKEDIKLKCKACGFVSDVDPRHKLNSYIIKNPPEEKMSKEEKRLKKAEEERMAGAEGERKKKEKKDKDSSKEKKEKKEKKDKKKKDQDDGNGEAAEDSDDDVEDEEEDGVVWMTDTSAEAAKKRAEEQLSAATAALVTQGNIEAEAEAERKRAEKEAKRKAEEEEAKRREEEAALLAQETAQNLALAEAAANSPVSQIRALISKGCPPSDVAAAVKALTGPGGLPGKVAVLLEAVFCAPSAAERKLVELIQENKALLAALGGDPAGQLAQLIALEYILTVAAPERGKETALVLKTLYDEDLAEDEIIVAWGDKSDAAKSLNVPLEAAKGIRKIAAPVLEWLQEDEEEDDE
ncbi:hypothetical protein CEUSTIGMA_g1019.t1 [Chlamydomonas eustigma]|uniref:W2 domain-containing protein n=1 Tax=Chlamydomonas eustigma TaxID=1157962 RepID=A0A250WRV6_9CHLO|nr:hypothetical protein CEUSTIGMA_g1019.t1 [Chlamydomonas eustigma]|eukprot:GAX73568.1 hypothetical protein CEUSTIGMA_g1019.t1 [Chlamydomonas eustigma]